ncbi:MAG: RNA-binding S4 domain-containing protein [Colwellia sp.]|nr:RNA-binding S4 domain-containing protein [Colwellia sp.]
MSESYLEIQLDQQPIELCKLLKIANLVAGGGEAKIVISEGYVLLNGEVEYQKRKKIYHNDIVEFNGETLQIIINENLEDELSKENVVQSTQPQSATSIIDKQETQVKVAPNNDSATKKSKRKPISF